ncbi:UDP-glucose 4-epimerase GalE [Sphingosinicellaceae bacterium]|nr:UDP-glucose 4-epimerase GalE [Sphingosinicellaceae bacterium]
MSDTGTVLVTGGAGYIGSHAVLALRDAGYSVVVIDNLATGFRWALPADVPLVEGDIADAALVARTLVEHRVGAVMHFAGSIIVPESVGNPLKYYRNNTAASRTLIEAAVTSGVKHFIFSSTAAVYGMPDISPIGEDVPKAPINPYGTSKLMTELMLRDVAAAHPINYGVLRYFNVAGADPHGRSGQSTDGATHLIKVACEAATGKRDHVTVFGTDYPTADGTGVRDYIHVHDLAAAHVAMLVKLAAEPDVSLTFNCGYSRGFSVMEVLDAVDRVTNMKIERVMAPRRAGDPPALVADNARILAGLEWKPVRDNLDWIIADALAWERSLALRHPS